MAQLDHILELWYDASAIVGSTPRIDLSAQIGPLWQLKRQAAIRDVPEGAGSTVDLIVSYMESTIDGYLALLAERSPDPYTHATDVPLEL